MMPPGPRLSRRSNALWSRSFLVHHYLWRNVDAAAGRALAALRANGVEEPRVLDVGCGERPYQELFAGCSYVGLNDSACNARPDFIADAQRMPLRDESVDLVFCSQVVEHVTDPQRLLGECARVLRPEGWLLLTAPMFWPLHEEPHDYLRFTAHGLRLMSARAGFPDPHITPDGGSWAQVGQSLALALPRWARPLVPMSNLCFLALDGLGNDRRCPINYTVEARKPPPSALLP